MHKQIGIIGVSLYALLTTSCGKHEEPKIAQHQQEEYWTPVSSSLKHDPKKVIEEIYNTLSTTILIPHLQFSLFNRYPPQTTGAFTGIDYAQEPNRHIAFLCKLSRQEKGTEQRYHIEEILTFPSQWPEQQRLLRKDFTKEKLDEFFHKAKYTDDLKQFFDEYTYK